MQTFLDALPLAKEKLIAAQRQTTVTTAQTANTLCQIKYKLIQFIALDHCSAARVRRFEAPEPIRQGCRRRFGGMAWDSARGRAVRHDHGPPYISDHFQTELAFLGIDSSAAYVQSRQGNGCAERFIRTLQENLLWVRSCKNVEALRQALLAFRETCNNTWLIERHDFLGPADYRRPQLQPLAQAAQAAIRCPKNCGRYILS